MFPVDIGVTKQKTYNQFVSQWKNEMNEAIQIAQQKADKSAELIETSITERFTEIT